MALVMRDDLIAFTRDRLSLFLPLAELTDQKIDEIAMTLGRAFFRAGILLGLHPSEIDRIQENRRDDLWSINLDILNTWRRSIENPATERLQLARVLKRLGEGRLAASVEPIVVESPGPDTFIDPSQASFSMAELDEISRQVAEDWQRLAIYLGVRQDRITQICHSNDDIMTKSFRSILWWYEQGNVSRKALADALVKISKGRLASKVYLHV